jgi:hypothetical protein
LQARKELAGALTEWAQIDLGDVAKDFSAELIKSPAGVGQAIATGLFDHEKGKNMGQVMAKAIVQSFASQGKALAGQLATQGIEKLIATIIGQNIFASAQVTALATNTTAIGVLIAAINADILSRGGTVASTTVGTAAGAGGIAGGLKKIWDTIFHHGSQTPPQTPTVPPIGGTSPVANAGGVLGSTLGGDQCCQQTKDGIEAIKLSFQKQLANSASQSDKLGSISDSTKVTAGVSIVQLPLIAVALWNLVFKPSILGTTYATGGDPDPSKPFIAGEKGPEIIHPKGAAVTVVPNAATKLLLQQNDITSLPKLPDGATDIIPHAKVADMMQTQSSNTNSSKPDLRPDGLSIHLHGANFYGVSNTREMMRQVAAYSKLVSPKFSPATS